MSAYSYHRWERYCYEPMEALELTTEQIHSTLRKLIRHFNCDHTAFNYKRAGAGGGVYHCGLFYHQISKQGDRGIYITRARLNESLKSFESCVMTQGYITLGERNLFVLAHEFAHHLTRHYKRERAKAERTITPRSTPHDEEFCKTALRVMRYTMRTLYPQLASETLDAATIADNQLLMRIRLRTTKNGKSRASVPHLLTREIVVSKSRSITIKVLDEAFAPPTGDELKALIAQWPKSDEELTEEERSVLAQANSLCSLLHVQETVL